MPLTICWALPGKLGGCPRPGLHGDMATDLSAIKRAGAGTLITLTEEWQPDAALMAQHGLGSFWLPIADFTPPTIDQASLACTVAEAAMDAGQAVVFHCRAGQGRTGTLLACQLVWQGAPADQAIAQVRGANHHYIETDAQAAFVAEFGQHVKARNV